MKDLYKTALIAVGVFGVLVAANVASEAIYTNSKVGTDKKTLLLSGAIGLVIGGTLIYFIKK